MGRFRTKLIGSIERRKRAEGMRRRPASHSAGPRPLLAALRVRRGRLLFYHALVDGGQETAQGVNGGSLSPERAKMPCKSDIGRAVLDAESCKNGPFLYRFLRRIRGHREAGAACDFQGRPASAHWTLCFPASVLAIYGRAAWPIIVAGASRHVYGT